MKEFIKTCWYKFTPEHPRVFLEAKLGWCAYKVLPEKITNRYYDGIFTDNQFFSRSMRRELVRRYHLLPESEKLNLNRKKMCGGVAAQKWHELTRTENKSFVFRDQLIQEMNKLILKHPGFSTVLEIGTGNGVFLDQIEKTISKNTTIIKSFAGIDLNKEQIEENKKIIPNKNISFQQGEVLEWIEKRDTNSGVLFVSVGVFEFFLESELKALLKQAKEKLKPVAFCIIEPVNINLKTEFESKPRGNLGFSGSLSHNYNYLFKTAGYEIFWEKIEVINPQIPNYLQVSLIALANVA